MCLEECNSELPCLHRNQFYTECKQQKSVTYICQSVSWTAPEALMQRHYQLCIVWRACHSRQV